MDYKEKIIGILTNNELTLEQKRQLEKIFPELKESEDERIRKEIIDYIKTGTYKKDWIAWLEKQGEKMSDPRYSILNKLIEADDIYQMSINDEMVETAKNKAFDALSKLEISKLLELEKQGERKTPRWMIDFLDNYRRNIGCSLDHDEAKDVDGKILCIKEWLEKQGEQKSTDTCDSSIINGKEFPASEKRSYFSKSNDGLDLNYSNKPADKIEPKFREGEWVVWDNKISCRVDNVYQGKETLMYTITDTNNMTRSYSVKGFDNNAHLWTIQDAKDGDVLTLNNEYFLFKGIKKSAIDVYISYCFVDSAGTFRSGGEFRSIERGIKVYPATKEQRDFLFQKMQEVGYEWDVDKKELKKIPYFRRDLMQADSIMVESSWSERDEEMIQIIKRQLGGTLDGITLPMTCWLNSLKDRIINGKEN